MALPKKAQIISVVLLAVAVAGVLYANRPESSSSTQSTDDAYVHADFTTVAPQVSGTIETVLIEDNQRVEKGDVLATLDDRDFVAAVNAANAQVASARASIASLQAHLSRQQTAIRQAQAAVAADVAALKLASANQARYRNLAHDGSGTVQARQQAEAQLSIQRARRDRSEAGLQAARQQVDVLRADLEKALAALAHAQATQAIEELKLSYTRITAPIAGTIGQKSVRIGAFVNTGQPLLAIVPLDAVYITANFRETQLARVAMGQAVDITVDALPGESLLGTVQSLGPASGVSYSAIAPHNATGNFTKIVQRLPVRIRIDPDQPAAAKLRVGMSVTPHIRIDG
ncbi:HlyD family secretion protein [Pseudomonas sp. SWRI12]|uniref:HlyD family secretion protein n=1 Tax=Pseudomonas zanjanensis TaxID=2745496 RepID=A0A923FHW8_9PSED|nr:HlyD family secretion protein [Pseudomonas zanjanensis]MBV4495588.1 HlyD family secretion protein [Pseudomonas zanjanensis]